jgi:SnoaL-like domain
MVEGLIGALAHGVKRQAGRRAWERGMDEAAMIRTYMEAIAAFNAGDMDGFGSMLADDCSLMRGRHEIATTREEFVAVMSQAREQGFVGQTIVSASAHGNVVVSLYRSSYADGTSGNGGGVLLFNDEGKATHVRTLGGH